MVQRFFDAFCNELIGTEYGVEGLGQRGVADLIETRACRVMDDLVSGVAGFLYAESRGPRSPEDFAINSLQNAGLVFVMFDVKTRNEEAEFSMPNLISIERLWNILENVLEDIFYIFIEYSTEGDSAEITNVEIRHITNLSLDDLTIGNLGRGQLQIRDGAHRVGDSALDPGEWKGELASRAVQFNERLLDAVQNRIILWTERRDA